MSGEKLGVDRGAVSRLSASLRLTVANFSGCVARSIAIRSYDSNVVVVSSGRPTAFSKLAATAGESFSEAGQHRQARP